mgnify:CR=1 FL=1
MSMRYNYSVERKNAKGMVETLQVTNCDSFDEAIKVVEKGLRDREIVDTQYKEAKLKEAEGAAEAKKAAADAAKKDANTQ